MEKLLTIVIPVYNTEQYLPRCIESVIVPEYMNHLEILIVIDGSPDNSMEVAKQYEKQYPNNIKVINQENGGHGSTINKGLELATGKYFRVLDSDDWFNKENFPVYLSKLNNANEDIVMTHISREFVYQNRSELQEIKGIEYDIIYNANSFHYIEQPIEFFAMARCTIKTVLLKKNNFKLTEKVYFEEAFLHVFPLPFLTTFIFYDLIIYHYFIGRPGQSVTPEISLKHNEHWQKLIRQIVDFYLDNQQKFNNNQEKFIFKVMRVYIASQYSRMNHFNYQKSKEEFARWDKYVASLPFSPMVTDYKRKLYSVMPYFFYRLLYKFRIWYSSKLKI